MEDKENQIPRAGQKAAGRPKRRLRPKGYYQGAVGFSKPLYPLGDPTNLRERMPEEKLRRKSNSAEDLFVFTANPKQKSRRKTACTLMWGDEEEDDALLQCDCDQWLKRDVQKPTEETPKSAEATDGCVLAKPGFVENAYGPEDLILEELSAEEATEHQGNEPQVKLESFFQAQTHDNDEDCGYRPHRKKSKAMRSAIRGCIYGIMKNSLCNYISETCEACRSHFPAQDSHSCLSWSHEDFYKMVNMICKKICKKKILHIVASIAYRQDVLCLTKKTLCYIKNIMNVLEKSPKAYSFLSKLWRPEDEPYVNISLLATKDLYYKKFYCI